MSGNPQTDFSMEHLMIKFSRVAAAVALALTSGVALALPVIDDFSVAQLKIEDTLTGDGVVWAVQVEGADILGGYRDVYVEKTKLSNDDTFAGVTAATFNGSLSYNENSEQAGVGVIRWDGISTGGDVNTSGLGGLDLTAFGSALNVLVLDADDSSPLTFTVWSGIGYTSSSLTIYSLEGAGSYTFSFSDFIGADFTNVGALELQINNGTGANLDTRIDMVSVVPEPGTLALAGIALLGLGAIRRRKS